MNIVIISFALFIFFSGVYVGQKQSPPVLSSESEESPQPTPEVTPQPTVIPTPQPMKSDTPQTSVEVNMQNYIYPGAKVTVSTSTSLNLESNDNPDTITNWYKDKIKSESMNVTSFVVTKTNGNVLNKLVGAKEGMELRVEIKKNAKDSTVYIIVSVRA